MKKYAKFISFSFIIYCLFLIVNLTNASKRLFWQPNPESDSVLYYTVYYSNANSSIGTALGQTSDTLFTVIDADNGDRFYYHLTATNAYGTSDTSIYIGYQFYENVGSTKKIRLRANRSRTVDLRTLFDPEFASTNIWELWVDYDSLYVKVSFDHKDSYEEAYLKITADKYNCKETVIDVTGVGDDVMGQERFYPGALSHIKIRITGGIDPPAKDPLTGIDDQNAPPTEYDIKTYPNPFNSSVTAQLELPEAGVMKLNLVNILGQKITLINEYYPAGIHRVSLNNHLKTFSASGTYFLVLKTPTGSLIIKKINYVK